MNAIIPSQLIRKAPSTEVSSNSAESLEKHMVHAYLRDHNLDYHKSPFIEAYFSEFKPDSNMIGIVNNMGFRTLSELAGCMESLIPGEDKKQHGAFFTPDYIADYIVTSITPDYNAKILDPSCGSSAFLLAIIRYYKKFFNKSVRDCIRENVFGADILTNNIHRSQIVLALMALENNEIVENHEINLYCRDSLSYCWNDKFNAIVGNPPYVKFQDMDEERRTFLLNNFKTTNFGTFNLYFAFFELGLRLLDDNGKLGFITPNNYFTSLAGESLREFFQKEECLYKIVDFNSSLIFNVQTYTAISFLNKKKNKTIAYTRLDDQTHPSDFLNNKIFTDNSYTAINKKKWRLLCGNERENIDRIEGIGKPLGKIFNICVGIATLKDVVYLFIPDSEDEQFYYITKDGHNFSLEKELVRSVVKISELKNEQGIKTNKRKIIFPYTCGCKKVEPLPEHIMASQYPGIYNYFLHMRKLLSRRDKGKGRYGPFYAYGRTQGLNRKGSKLLTPTFSKSPRFVLDKDPHSFFTNGYGIYERGYEENLFGYPSIAHNLDVAQKILNSCVMAYYVDKTSVSIAGGYPCYQKNFIERFSIPQLSMQEIEYVRYIDSRDEIDEFLIDKYQLTIPSPNRF